MKTSIFEFKDYRSYLDQTLKGRAVSQKGQRHKLAIFIGCNPGYLSKIFKGSYDLSLEQAHATNKFLGHTNSESKYFLTLVQWARAGTSELKEYFWEELSHQRDESFQLKNRIKIDRTLTEKDQAIYYSSWLFAAIHIFVSLDFFKTKEQIASALNLPLSIVNQTIEFLTGIGILKKTGTEYRQGAVNLFLDKDSPFIKKHHTNWRIKAIQALDQAGPLDFHYSGIVTCSKEDIEQIREILSRTVQNVRATVSNAKKSNSFYCYTVDLFSLLKTP